MAAAAVPMIAGGGIVGAYGSYESGKANRDLLRHNAEVSRMQAEQAIEGGESKAGVEDTKHSLIGGAQLAQYAGQGVVANAGTAGQVEGATQAMGEYDKLLVRTQAARQAWGLNTQAQDYENQAELAYRGGITGAVSSLLGAGGQAASASARSPSGGGGMSLDGYS